MPGIVGSGRGVAARPNTGGCSEQSRWLPEHHQLALLSSGRRVEESLGSVSSSEERT